MRIVAMLGLLLLTVPSANVAPQAPRAGHPLLGIWELRLPDSACTEVYRFRGDGTSLVTSRQEVSESEFRAPPQPDTQGFYPLDDLVVKNNGKEDCSGLTIEVGASVRNYLRFHPSNDMFFMCVEESLDACIGPFRRVTSAGV